MTWQAARVIAFCMAIWMAGTVQAQAESEIIVRHERNNVAATEAFQFKEVPAPAKDDAASTATFQLVEGERDANGGELAKLNDGVLPSEADEPRANFFFRAGTDGGRLLIDLRKEVDVAQVNSYSWHVTTRAPQVYTLYASSGESEAFASRPARSVDPVEVGWERIAEVDTRPRTGDVGGQYGVSIARAEGSIGRFRYLLLDIRRTQDRDAFGNTFFSEIDVVEAGTQPVAATAVERTGRQTYLAGDGAYRLIVDTSETPDLEPWVREELAPVIQEWYPKIVDMLPSEGYEAPRQVFITFRADMRGVAAASGARIECAAAWFRANLRGEAKGAVVHELVHAVQQYGLARRTNPRAVSAPHWVVEGIADYIRWFLYEPESRGAEIAERNVERVRHDDSYRVSANFLAWATRAHDSELLARLNDVARRGEYNPRLWEEWTGHTLEQLEEQWKADLASRARTVRP